MAIKNLSSVQNALAEAKQIEKFAFESAKKAMETTFAPQIEEAVLKSLREIENVSNEEKIESTISESIIDENESITEINEDIKLDVSPDGTLNISVSPENSTIETSQPSPEINSEPEMTNDQEEIYEVEGVGAIDAPMPAPTDGSAETPVTEPEPSISDIESTLSDMAQKLDSILNAINPNAEGQVDVIDDENQGAQSAPAAPQPAPAAPTMPNDNVVSEDDVMFEIDEEFMNALSEMNTDFQDDSMEEINLSEMDDLDEIEIVAEEDGDNEEFDETMEEMRGLGNAVKRSAANRQEFEKSKFQHAPIAMNEDVKKIKVQYESIIDELTKENSSLTEAVEEYKQNIQEFSNSFVQLQKQINEMHVFNGKLAYANKLLSKGGLTNGEKIKIAEAFDKAESVEEAKKLYTQFLNEMKSDTGIAHQVKDLKTAKPTVAQSTKTPQSEVIFESAERKRMRELAGIKGK